MITVLISGASGFIALQTVKLLLKKGYAVVGTVRSTEKGDNIKQLLGSDKFSYEVVKDLEVPGAFDQFVKNHPEATIFLHTASPFTYNVTDFQTQMLDPAINGTKGVLTAIKEHGPQIKRVVVTSSFAAVTSAIADDPTVVINEDTWSSITLEQGLENIVFAYFASKTFAEKAAWTFVEEEKPNFALTVVNPTFVFGPQPFDELVSDNLNTSLEIINTLTKLTSADKDWYHANGMGVDVRDVAAAHVAAFQKDEAKNQRLILSAGAFTDQTVLDILHKKFPEESKDVPLGTPGSDRVFYEGKAIVDTSRTQAILGFEFILFEDSIVDTLTQLYGARK